MSPVRFDERTGLAGVRAQVAPHMPDDHRRERTLTVEGLWNAVGYQPHPGQMKFHTARRKDRKEGRPRFRVVCAGRRWGKSRSSPHDLLPRMFLRKPQHGWIVAPTYDLGEKEFRVFWELLIDKLKIPVDKSKTFYSIRTKDFRITTAWGSVIEVRSAEHPDSLVGEGLDWVIMAEAAKLKLSHWEKYIRPTLSDKRGSAIFVSTPEGFNWFYDMYMRGKSRDKFADWWSLRSPTWENSAVFDGIDDPEMVEVAEGLTPETFQQEYGASFTSFAGRIYSEFDEGYHVVDKYAFNPEWPTIMGVDFGTRNPFAAISMQIDPPNGDVYIFHEYVKRGNSTTDNGRMLKSIIQWPVGRLWYDPAGKDAAGTLHTVFQERYEGSQNLNLLMTSMSPGNNNVKMGIERVRQHLKMRRDHNGQPKPKLYIARGCGSTIREFNLYRWKEQTETMADRMDPVEEPMKKNDHCLDAIRYALMGYFGEPRTSASQR